MGDVDTIDPHNLALAAITLMQSIIAGRISIGSAAESIIFTARGRGVVITGTVEGTGPSRPGELGELAFQSDHPIRRRPPTAMGGVGGGQWRVVGELPAARTAVSPDASRSRRGFGETLRLR